MQGVKPLRWTQISHLRVVSSVIIFERLLPLLLTKPQTSCRKESRLYHQLAQSQHPSSDPNNDDSKNLLNSKSLVCAGAFGGTTARSVATTSCRACAGARAGGCTGSTPTTDTDSDCTASGTRTGGPTTTAYSAYTGTFARPTTTTTRRIILNKDIKRGPESTPT